MAKQNLLLDERPLKIGQKVYSGLYGGRYGVITEIKGEQKPDTIKTLGGGVMVTGGRAMITVLFNDYSLSRGIPESIVRGVQWKISDEIESYGQILKDIQRAEEERKAQEIMNAIKAEADAKEREALPSKYPLLTPVSKSGKSAIVTAATNIRKELKEAFKGVKFSVTSRHGSSIDISWTDGPTSEEVNKIARKYKHGYFDGMDDSYHYTRDNFGDVFGSAQYVFCNRTHSRELLRKAAAEYGWIIEFDQWNGITNLNGLDNQTVYREATKIKG